MNAIARVHKWRFIQTLLALSVVQISGEVQQTLNQYFCQWLEGYLEFHIRKEGSKQMKQLKKCSKSTRNEENWNAANVVNLAIMWGHLDER